MLKLLKKIINSTGIKEFLKFALSRPPKLCLTADYNDYWSSKRPGGLGTLSSFQKKRADIIKKYISANTTIKDIGCGDGSILAYLSKETGFAKIFGVDVSDKVLNHIKQKGFIPVKSDMSKLEKVENIPETDFTIVFELLEHLPNPEEVLIGLLKKTKKALFFSVPNTGFVGHRIRLLFGSFPLQWRLNPGDNLRFWTYRDMKWWLNELGLEKRSEVRLYEGIILLNKVLPSLFAMGILVVIRMDNSY